MSKSRRTSATANWTRWRSKRWRTIVRGGRGPYYPPYDFGFLGLLREATT